MQHIDSTPPLCQSVFRSGTEAPSPASYTEVWIQVLRQMEWDSITVP